MDYSKLSDRQLNERILEMLTKIADNTTKEVDVAKRSKFNAKSTNKIPIGEFCLLVNKNRRQVYRLFEKHPGLKAKVPGEKESRVNLDVWYLIVSMN